MCEARNIGCRPVLGFGIFRCLIVVGRHFEGFLRLPISFSFGLEQLYDDRSSVGELGLENKPLETWKWMAHERCSCDLEPVAGLSVTC